MLYVLSFSKTRHATTNSIFRYAECWLTIFKKKLGHYYLHTCLRIFPIFPDYDNEQTVGMTEDAHSFKAPDPTSMIVFALP